MLNNAMDMTDDRSTKVGHCVAMLAVDSFKLSFAEFCCGL